jgi:uncharacterized membrane protein HdeD (DUF308 family)
MTTLVPNTSPASAQQSNIWWLFLLQGIAGILLGLMLLTYPGATVVVLVTFLGFYWLFTGVMALVRVFVDRSVPWIWSLLVGIVGILAGLVVLRHPLLAALTVPTTIVIILGVQGLIMGVLDMIGGFQGGGARSFLLGIINVVIGALLLGSPLIAALSLPLVFGVLTVPTDSAIALILINNRKQNSVLTLQRRFAGHSRKFRE